MSLRKIVETSSKRFYQVCHLCQTQIELASTSIERRAAFYWPVVDILWEQEKPIPWPVLGSNHEETHNQVLKTILEGTSEYFKKGPMIDLAKRTEAKMNVFYYQALLVSWSETSITLLIKWESICLALGQYGFNPDMQYIPRVPQE